MKLIRPSFEIIDQQPGIDGMYRHIELAGRTCYKSEDKITEDSAKAFVGRMIGPGHLSVLEHGTVYLDCPERVFQKYSHNKYSTGNYAKEDIKAPEEYSSSLYYHQSIEHYYITTNLRVLVENRWLDDLKYWCEPTPYHVRRYTVKFTMDRIGSQSFCRHRVFSFSQESTRFCRYSSKKFGGEVTYILPPWMDDSQLGEHDSKKILRQAIDADIWAKEKDMPELYFLAAAAVSEISYMTLLNQGWSTDRARSVLPNILKTEIVMTGFADDWVHFFDLRCPHGAHEQASELAIPLRKEFIKRKYIR